MSTFHKLYRHATYPHPPLHEAITRDRSFETHDGKKYRFIINNDELSSFELMLPTGQVIQDTLAEFGSRKALYELLGDGVYEMLVATMLSIQGEMLKLEWDVPFVVKMTGERYVFTANSKTGYCKLEYPVRLREFYIDNIYVQCPDLPILYDGKLNAILRDKAEELGLSMPDTPYELGFKVTKKYV